MPKFVPLSEQSSKELKAGLRAVNGSIGSWSNVSFVDEPWYQEIMNDLVIIALQIKKELARRMGFCQDKP